MACGIKKRHVHLTRFVNVDVVCPVIEVVLCVHRSEQNEWQRLVFIDRFRCIWHSCFVNDYCSDVIAMPVHVPVKIKLGQIQPWTDNPRMSTKAQAQRLIKSERRLGQIQTLAIGPMIDGKYPLYDGHQRVSSWLTVKTPDFEVMALQSNRPLTEGMDWWKK